LAAKNKARGNRLENKVVKMMQAVGAKAVRAWGSDGRSLGLSQDVDVLMNDTVRFQCKMKKKFPKWIGVSETVDYNIIQTDHKPPQIIIPLEEWLELITRC